MKLQIFMLEKKPEAGSNYIFWLLILIDSVFKKDKTIICNCFEKMENL